MAEDKNVGVNQELQLLKLELNGNTAGRKGNSLFSEVNYAIHNVHHFNFHVHVHTYVHEKGNSLNKLGIN